MLNKVFSLSLLLFVAMQHFCATVHHIPACNLCYILLLAILQCILQFPILCSFLFFLLLSSLLPLPVYPSFPHVVLNLTLIMEALKMGLTPIGKTVWIMVEDCLILWENLSIYEIGYGAVQLVTANFVQWLCSTATAQNRSSRNRIRENNIILPLNTCILLENITQT